MGRTATIEKNDVSSARGALRRAGKPHGIIAIRNHLGRGSPQLIGRFLAELESPPSKRHIPPESPRVEADAELSKMRRAMVTLEHRAIVAESQNALLRASVESVRQELFVQREMFEQWRSDILQVRSLLTEPIDELTVTIADRARPPKSANNMTINTGEQLDLYGSDGNKG